MSQSDRDARWSRRQFLASSALGAVSAATGVPDAQAGPAAGPPGTGASGWQVGPFDSMREYVAELDRRGLLLTIDRIDQDAFDFTALAYRLVDRFGLYGAPAVLAKQVRSAGRWVKGPVVTNLYGPWETECLAFGALPVRGDGRASYRRGMERIAGMMSAGRLPTSRPRIVEPAQAPCRQVVAKGDAVDLGRFAFLQSNPADAGRYVNTGSVITSDPELGRNFGTYRCQVQGPAQLGVNPEPGQGGWRMLIRAKERGETRAPVSIVLGQDPVMWMVSSSKIARGVADEYDVVSGMRGRPIELVKCETNDHLVPAHAEMVIEGEIALDHMLPEGPFGESFGYLGARKEENFVMRVTCVTHRRDPWVHNMFTGVTRGFPKAALDAVSLRQLQRTMPNVTALHTSSEAQGVTFVALRKQAAGEGLALGRRLAETSLGKVIVVVDEDVDVVDSADVLHALASCYQPGTATLVLPDGPGMPLDPSLTRRPRTSKLVVDATRQWPEEGGPREFQAASRTLLKLGAPDALQRVDADWDRLVGRWRPPA